MFLPGAGTLIITHTDRDGLLSGAALLRSLELCGGVVRQPDILLTQGCYLADELEDLLEAGLVFDRIFALDTYWHPPHQARIVAGLNALLGRRANGAGGELIWIDHHPSSVEGERFMREKLNLSGLSRIQGDREGRFEAVSLVAEVFGTRQDPVVSGHLEAIFNGWRSNRVGASVNIEVWLDVIDGLPRSTDLPASDAAAIVRELAGGVSRELPVGLQPLQEKTRVVKARTRLLAESGIGLPLPSVGGGWGLLLDLREELNVNAYELQLRLSRAASGQIDYFVVQEASSKHYVSGKKARCVRDFNEGTVPPLRVGTLRKGAWRGTSPTECVGPQKKRAIDLAHLTCRHPAPDFIHGWVDCYPYLVKGVWRPCVGVDDQVLQLTARAIGEAMESVLGDCGWGDNSTS